jgi:hypothetical protein
MKNSSYNLGSSELWGVVGRTGVQFPGVYLQGLFVIILPRQ